MLYFLVGERDGRKGERKERREGEVGGGGRRGKIAICVLQATKTGEGLEICYSVSM